MTLAGSRPKCLAGGGPLERRVRRPDWASDSHSQLFVRTKRPAACGRTHAAAEEAALHPATTALGCELSGLKGKEVGW